MVIDKNATADDRDLQETRPKKSLDNTIEYDVVQDNSDGSEEMTYEEARQHNIRGWVEASTCTSPNPCKTVINKNTKRSMHLHFNPDWTPDQSASFRMCKYTSAQTTPEGRRVFGIHNDTDGEGGEGVKDGCFDSDWGSTDSAYSDGAGSDASLSYSDPDSNFGSSFEPLGFRELYHKKHEHDGVSTEMMDALQGIEDDVTACVRKHFASATDTARKAFGSSLPYITGSLDRKAWKLGVDPEKVRSCLESVTKCFVQEVVADQLEDFRQRIVNSIDAAVQREVLNSYESQQECLKLAAEGAIEEKEEERSREQRRSEHFRPVRPVSTDAAMAQRSLKRSYNQMVDDDMEVDEGDEADTEAEPVTKRMKKLKIRDETEILPSHPVGVGQQTSATNAARREGRGDVYERSTSSETAPNHTESPSRRVWRDLNDFNDSTYNYNRERALSACSSRRVLMFE